MSPWALVVAGLAAVLGYVSGGGVAGAIVLALIAFAGWVAAVRLRRPRAERIDPFTVQDPWRSMILRARATGNRFEEAVRNTSPGPLRDRLAEVNGRVATGVREAWAIAQRGHALDNAVQALDRPGIRRKLDEAERSSTPHDANQEAIVQALRNQLESAERLAAVSDNARSRLARLNAELDESVARAVELSLSTPDPVALQPLGAEVESVVTELEALRLALDETS